MTTINEIGNQIAATGERLVGLQQRIGTMRGELREAAIMLDAQHKARMETAAVTHARLMDFIDAQIRALDEAIEGPPETMPVAEYRQAAE